MVLGPLGYWRLKFKAWGLGFSVQGGLGVGTWDLGFGGHLGS